MSTDIDKHAEMLGRYYGGFQLEESNEEAQKLRSEIASVVRRHSKDSWYRPTNLRIRDAVLPLKSDSSPKRDSFILGSLFRGISNFRSDSPAIFRQSTGGCIYFKLNRKIVLCVDELDIFSPLWVFDKTTYPYRRDVCSVPKAYGAINKHTIDERPNHNDGGVNQSIMPGSSSRVEIMRIPTYKTQYLSLPSELKITLKIGYEKPIDCYADSRRHLDEMIEVLNEFFLVVGRKAVRGLSHLKPIIGPLRPLGKERWAFDWAAFDRVKGIDPYTSMSDSSFCFSSRAQSGVAVRVISE